MGWKIGLLCTADPMTIQEVKRAIAQAISDHVKLRQRDQDVPM